MEPGSSGLAFRARAGRRLHVPGQLLADVAGPEPPILSPVGVPVGTVWAARAVLPAAPDALLAVGDLPGPLHVGAGIAPLPRDQEPPDEDEQPAEVELDELTELAHQDAVDGHLRRECTQEPNSSKPDSYGPEANL